MPNIENQAGVVIGKVCYQVNNFNSLDICRYSNANAYYEGEEEEFLFTALGNPVHNCSDVSKEDEASGNLQIGTQFCQLEVYPSGNFIIKSDEANQTTIHYQIKLTHPPIPTRHTPVQNFNPAPPTSFQCQPQSQSSLSSQGHGSDQRLSFTNQDHNMLKLQEDMHLLRQDFNRQSVSFPKSNLNTHSIERIQSSINVLQKKMIELENRLPYQGETSQSSASSFNSNSASTSTNKSDNNSSFNKKGSMRKQLSKYFSF